MRTFCVLSLFVFSGCGEGVYIRSATLTKDMLDNCASDCAPNGGVESLTAEDRWGGGGRGMPSFLGYSADCFCKNKAIFKLYEKAKG